MSVRSVKDEKERERNKVLAEMLNHWFDKEKRTFTIDAPCNLTTKDRQGNFRRTAFIGDEKFTLTGAYQGASGHVFGIFRPVRPSPFVSAEFPLTTKADNPFRENLQAYIEDVLARRDDTLALSPQDILHQRFGEERLDQNAASKDHELFGTW